MKVLLENGAAVNKRDKEGRTALMFAVTAVVTGAIHRHMPRNIIS